MRAAILLCAAAIGCGGHAAAPASAPASAAPARRACVHGAEPVPASCLRASARGKVLKDDAQTGLRIYQACDGDHVIDGSYVAEHVGNGRKTRAEMIELVKAHQADLRTLGVLQSAFASCGGAGDETADDAGCVQVGFQAPNEDVPAVATDLMRIFGDAGDVCIGFRIDTGVAPP
jgi:hypothetical protein